MNQTSNHENAEHDPGQVRGNFQFDMTDEIVREAEAAARAEQEESRPDHPPVAEMIAEALTTEKVMLAAEKPAGKKEHRVVTGITAAELVAKKFPKIKWAIPDILPEGTMLLGGKPKQGKSLICLSIALSIASGMPALGRDVEPGTVLYFALEDVQRRLQSRIKQMMKFGGSAPKDLHLYTEWPRMGSGGLRALDEEIRRYGNVRLVIIDTLAKFRPVTSGKGSKTLYEIDYQTVDAIKQIADKLSVSILVVHHLRKSEGEDIFDTLSGSLGLTGAADGTMILERKTGQADASLHINGRDVEPAEFAMKFDSEFLSWRILGDASEVRSTEMQQKLFDALKEHVGDDGISPKELGEMTGLRGGYIRNILPSLIKSGQIRRHGRGRYKYVGEGI